MTGKPGPSVIDWAQLRSLGEVQADGEPDVIEKVIAMFQDDAPARIARAHAALQRGDGKALRLEAHSLRGTAGLIGAPLLQEAATAVEREAEAGRLDTIAPLVAAMATAAVDVREALAGGGQALRILIADDDRVSAAILSHAIAPLGLDVVVTSDGHQAWSAIADGNGPSLAIVDWMMPGLDGPSLCRRIRETPALSHMYVILLTARRGNGDMVEGLDAGADDYLFKPFDEGELRARVKAGVRVLALQQHLAARVAELQAALSEVKQLTGLLPICSYCKRIRNDDNYWEQVDHYVTTHSGAQFSHGICPPCLEKASRELDPPA